MTSLTFRDKLNHVTFEYSLIAQLVEHSTVNRVVTGSSPVRGAILIWRDTQVAIRGPSAKGLDCVSGAWVRIPLSPF